jgi:hypothetical protein
MRRATLLIFHYGGQHTDDPVTEADRLTSMADARTALCIEQDTALDDIDPSSGYDHSDRAYHHVRASWEYQVGQHPVTDWTERNARWAYGTWLEARPDLATGDRWPGLSDEDWAELNGRST